jgi:hypothetical protein
MKLVVLLTSCAAALALSCAAQAQTQTYITNFTKTDNIYTNLNEQFPNTGVGTPGSGVGVANASFLFDPTTYNATNTNDVNYTNNGIKFDITSNSTGQDFTEVGTANFGVSTLSLPINISNATSVYLLASAYVGTTINVTFTGTGGATQTFASIGLPDFSGGPSTNTVAGDLSDQTVYRVVDTGAGGTGNSTTGANTSYDLTELGFTLGSQFDGQTLESATITGNGYEGLILGATVTSLASTTGAVPEPATWAMMIGGFGVLGLTLRRARKPASLSQASAA